MSAHTHTQPSICKIKQCLM